MVVLEALARRRPVIVFEDIQHIIGKVNIGTKVNLKNLDNNEIHQFQLVDYHEADPLNGKISVDSPVGKIILGKSKNDKVTVKSPSGDIDYQIVSNSDR